MEGHRQIQAGLSPQGGQDGIGALLFDDLGDGVDVQRFDIHVVRDVLVRHNGGGVGVDQDNLQALLFQGTAGLGAGVVELRRLADDDGSGAQHQDLMNVWIFGH